LLAVSLNMLVTRRAAAAGLAVVVLVSVLAGAGAAPAPTSPDSTRKAIRELLDQRARAVMDGDEASFMATVGRGSPAFVGRQRRLFRGMQQLDLRSYRLHARWDRYGDLGGSFEVGDYAGAQATALPVTDEILRIRGFDDAENEELFYTFVKRGGTWEIAEDTDLESLGFLSARHLWDSGPLVATRSEHFLLLQHSCDAPVGCISVPDDVLGLAESALRRVAPYWSLPWSRHVIVLVPSSEAELQRMLAVTFDVSDFVAFAFGTSAPRIVVNPPSLAGRSRESLLTIFTHELLHVATRPRSGRFTPLFVEEGFADYVGRAGDSTALSLLHSRVVSGRFDGTLPRDFEFTAGASTDIFLAYQEAHSAVEFFVDTWGLKKFVRFYKRLGKIDVAAGTSGYHVDGALRNTIGIGFREFEERWADSLRG
jgi:hypothetical protein